MSNIMPEPGEAIGIIASHSIGQPTTQIALSSFHHAGSTATQIVQGLPRLEQIMNLSETNPICNIHYKPGQSIKTIEFKLNDIIDYYNIIDDFDSWWYYIAEECGMYNRPHKEQDGSILRLVFDRLKMVHYRINLRQIVNFISNLFPDEHNLRFLASPENIGIIDIVYNGGNLLNSIRARLFKLARDVLLPLTFNGAKIKGMVEQFDGSIMASCKLLDILNLDEVDPIKTSSYCIVDVYNTLGLEAARKCIVQELSKIIHGNIVYNDKHINLVADYMTHRGNLLPINSSGVSRTEEGTITRACYERTLKEIARACKFGSVEKVQSISEHILVGTRANIGTGFFNVD